MDDAELLELLRSYLFDLAANVDGDKSMADMKQRPNSATRACYKQLQTTRQVKDDTWMMRWNDSRAVCLISQPMMDMTDSSNDQLRHQSMSRVGWTSDGRQDFKELLE